jgi:hypothetical protein
MQVINARYIAYCRQDMLVAVKRCKVFSTARHSPPTAPAPAATMARATSAQQHRNFKQLAAIYLVKVLQTNHRSKRKERIVQLFVGTDSPIRSTLKRRIL